MTKYGAPHLRPTDIQGRNLLSFVLHSVSEGTLDPFSDVVECAGPVSRNQVQSKTQLAGLCSMAKQSVCFPSA